MIIFLGGVIYTLSHIYLEKYFLEKRVNDLKENLDLLASISGKKNISVEENIPLNKYKYSQIFFEIINLLEDDILLSSIIKEKETFVLEGTTTNYTILGELANKLFETGHFYNIEITKATRLTKDILDIENALSEINFAISLELREEVP